jgi:hypothetical protein
MNNRTLGTLALLGAPFLLIGMMAEEQFESLANSWFTGFWGLIYISAWLCSVVVLRRLAVAGTGRLGRGLPWVLIGSLLLANASNGYQLVAPGQETPVFRVLDAFWPLSNVLMLVLGVTIAVVGRLRGWQRYVPLIVGLWFPFAMAAKILLGRSPAAFWLGAPYTALAWSLLALVVLRPNLSSVNRPVGSTLPARIHSVSQPLQVRSLSLQILSKAMKRKINTYLLFLILPALLTLACKKSDDFDPATQSKAPTEVAGKWMWGTFSMSNFWTYDGQYAGKPFEQALVFDFKPNGEYEEYVINAVNSYGCKTEAFTYFKGKVKFDEDEQSFTITPTSGNYRGFYSCASSNNFKRDAKASELKVQKFYYEVRGGKLMLGDGPDNRAVFTLKSASW